MSRDWTPLDVRCAEDDAALDRSPPGWWTRILADIEGQAPVTSERPDRERTPTRPEMPAMPMRDIVEQDPDHVWSKR